MKPLSESIAALLLLLDGKGDGSTAKSLDQRLADAKSALVDIQTQADNLTRERATDATALQAAKDENTRLQQQFDSLNTEATTSKADVTRLTGELSSEKTAHTATRGQLESSNKNITRLESLLKLKGIPTDQAVPENGGGNPGGDAKPTLADLDAEMKAAGGHPDKVAAVVARATKFYGPAAKA